ncbi:MAG: F0F1 ATP synthase subunit A [Fimbriimonadaceae bacterium]|jgi:F-type H+-transporting ATPase subunit a|nr:F0F1 ATP synthase subunit A [Fimbriimonadaceae bacterium]
MLDSLAPVTLFLASAEGGEKAAKAPLPVMGMTALYIGIFLAVGLVILFYLGRSGFDIRGPKTTLAKLLEHVYLFIEGIAVSIIGGHGRAFLPFLITLWCLIFASNVFGLIMHISPTANMSFNLGLSVLTVLYVQYKGISANGLIGHLKHFAGPKLPANMFYIPILIFCVEILSEGAKIISLALRLFGNIAGGKLVVKNLDELSVVIGQNMLGIKDFHIEVPIGSVLIPIKLLTAIIQPFVWVVLTCVYLGMVTHHDHDHEDDHHESHDLTHEKVEQKLASA